jgi:hypothetical protein
MLLIVLSRGVCGVETSGSTVGVVATGLGGNECVSQ